MASQPQSGQWLLDAGLKQLELLFRAIVYPPAEPILIADNSRTYRDASCGAGRLFGLPRNRLIGRRLDEFAEPGFRPQIDQLWLAFLQRGEQRGTFRLVGSDGAVREVEYTAKGNALPERHVLALRDKSKKLLRAADGEDPAWVQDYALFLFDADGRIAGWYSGAERIYGYRSTEIAGQPVSCLYPDEDALGVKLKEELKRAAAQGHFGNEGWHIRKDESRFWANVLTMALRGEDGELQGFARVVRDFSKRRQAEEKLRRGGVLRLSVENTQRNRPLPASFQASSTISRTRMTRSFKWSVIAAKTWLQAGCTGRISLPRNTWLWMKRPMRKACGTGPARRSRKNTFAKTELGSAFWWRSQC